MIQFNDLHVTELKRQQKIFFSSGSRLHWKLSRAVNTKSDKMWFVYASLLFAVIAFVLRKYGMNFYHRFGRPVFLRRIVGKTRPPTPPLLDDRRRSGEHSVFQVYDDGSIVSSMIEKPPMVSWSGNLLAFRRWWIAQFVNIDNQIENY